MGGAGGGGAGDHQYQQTLHCTELAHPQHCHSRLFLVGAQVHCHLLIILQVISKLINLGFIVKTRTEMLNQRIF